MPSHSASVLTVWNLRTGVGRTHAVWLLAAVAHERGKKVLVVDFNTRGDLSRFLGWKSPESTYPKSETGSDAATIERRRSPLSQTAGIESLFDQVAEVDARSLVRRTPFRFIDLLPSSPLLDSIDPSNQTRSHTADLHFPLVDAVRDLRGHYDLIVLDCPPRRSVLSFASLCASDFVTVPLEAPDLGAPWIDQLMASIDDVKQHHNPDIAFLGYLVSRYRGAEQYQRSCLSKLRRQYGIQAFDTVIPDLAGFERSVVLRRPITLYAPASHEAGIARRLYAEVQRRISRARGAAHRSRRRDSTIRLALA